MRQSHSDNKKAIKNLYPPESAGSNSTRAVPIVSSQATFSDVVEMLSVRASDFVTINYIYVVDEDEKLTGVVSVKELFKSPKEKSVLELAERSLVTVRPHTDQERVALVALKHNIKAVPVVDKRGYFIGVVTSDTIISVLHKESIEDTLHHAGSINMDNPLTSLVHGSSWLHFRKRSPWLLIGLLGGVGAASVVSFFEHSIAEYLVLASFIPTVVYMADAVGSQTQTIFVRSLALEKKLDLKEYLKREAVVNFSLALLLGVAITILVAVFFSTWKIAFVVGIAIFFTVVESMVVALSMPYVLSKMGFDPAVGSGPFATVVQDILSLVIYFGVIVLLL